MNICQTCGQKCEELHIHHILPKSLGGTDLETNLVSICTICHSKIHNKNFLNHSELTKAGLARAKAKGIKLGGYREGHTAHHEAISNKAKEFAKEVGPRIEELRNLNKTYQDIADIFNEEKLPTPRGGIWYATSVRNAYKRYHDYATSSQHAVMRQQAMSIANAIAPVQSRKVK